jgi:hypothetical protein
MQEKNCLRSFQLGVVAKACNSSTLEVRSRRIESSRSVYIRIFYLTKKKEKKKRRKGINPKRVNPMQCKFGYIKHHVRGLTYTVLAGRKGEGEMMEENTTEQRTK